MERNSPGKDAGGQTQRGEAESARPRPAVPPAAHEGVRWKTDERSEEDGPLASAPSGVRWKDEPILKALSSQRMSTMSANSSQQQQQQQGPEEPASYEDWTWDSIEEFSGLQDDSPQAEARRRELIKNVYMYELVNSNLAYQRHMQIEHAREEEDAHVLAHYQLQPGARTWLARCWGRWRSSDACKETYMTLTYAEHSQLAWYINLVIIVAILWSTAMFCLETVPSIERGDNMAWIRISSYICLGIFTVEFLGRILTCPMLWQFITSPMNIIDFLAIFPSYIEIILAATDSGGEGAGQTRVIRLIRLLRVFRLLRLWSRFKNVSVIVDAIVASLDVLFMMFFLLIIMLISFSAIIYYVESDVNPGIDSIPQAMYFIQTTLTTTGYGEVTPITWPGRALCGVLMLTAIITLALPISVIGANFTNMWTDYKSMRNAASRSEQVWTNFRSLNLQVSHHKAVLEDVSQHLRCTQENYQSNIGNVLESSRKARLLYLMRVTQGKAPGWQHDLDQLRSLRDGMRHNLNDARQWWEHLEVAAELSHMTRADEFMSKLDRIHMAYKNLRKWFEEGVYMAQEVQLLTDDINILKDTIKNPLVPITTTAAAAAAATAATAAAAAAQAQQSPFVHALV